MDNELEQEALEARAADAAEVEVERTPPKPKPSKPKPAEKPDPKIGFKPMYTTGQIVEVKAKTIEIAEDKNDPLYDIRALLPVDEALEADIEKDGFNSLPWVIERGAPGHLKLVAGRRRIKAVNSNANIEVLILNPAFGDYDLVRLMVSENERQFPDNVMNRARKAKRMLELGLEQLRPAAEGVKQDDETGEILYTGDAWEPTAKQRREILEAVAKAFGVTRKRIQDQMLPLVEDLSPKVQKALEQNKIAEAVALKWKDKTFEQQEKSLERALEKAAGEKIRGKGSTRKSDGTYPTLKFKRPQLEDLFESEVAPKPVQEFLAFYLGHHDLEQAPRWIQRLMAAAEAEEEGEAE